MRALLLLVLLAPSASAWGVEVAAPRAAGEGLPFLVDVCAQVPGRGQVRVLAQNASLDVREDRYLPAFEERACREVEVRPGMGVVRLEARVRAEGGGGVRARGFANVTLLGVPFVASAQARVLDVRAPLVDGWALLPAFEGAGLPPPARVRIVEARAPPQEGVVLVNEGEGPAPLAVFRLDGARVSNATLAPGATLVVPMPVRPGELVLSAAARVVSTLHVPALRPGEGTLGPYGRTNLSASPQRVEGEWLAYAMPASGTAPLVALVDSAHEEVLVEAYTLTSADVGAALARAVDRGARVRVLLEREPVGGVPHEERALVAALAARGAEVFTLGGEGARYRTLHAKLVVADRARVSVATENLNEMTARGFGLVVANASLARAVGEVIEADLDGHDVAPFAAGSAPGVLLPSVAHERRPPASWTAAWNATLVLSPDDPGALARAVAGARERVRVQMLRAEPDAAMVEALVAAARAGADARIELDARVDDGVNIETAARLNALATREGLALEARLADPGRMLHAKAFVVDGRVAYAGSMNWVRAAWAKNREAGLLVESEELAGWLEVAMEEKEEPAALRGVPAAPAVVAIGLSAFSARRPLPRARSRARGGA